MEAGPAAREDASLERFDPGEDAGKLIDSEHRGRYWWAAQAVAGRDVLDAGCGVGYGLEALATAGAASVTGVDIDEGAVERARERRVAGEILTGDLRKLPFEDESFDVVVCFETIHHVADGERALGELHRVLRPDGLLLISSPSPDVFPPGNEHHVHEYRPTDLSAVIEERFENVARHRQHPWLASTIEPAPNGADPAAPRRRETRVTAELSPGAETYSILAASDAELPDLEEIVVLGSDFEVKWWAEQVTAAQSGARDPAAEAREARSEERIEAAERRAHDAEKAAEGLERRHVAIENELRRELAVLEASERSTKERLREVNEALLEANQELARLSSVHRVRSEQLSAHIELIESSRSWRYLAPLRRVRHFFRR